MSYFLLFLTLGLFLSMMVLVYKENKRHRQIIKQTIDNIRERPLYLHKDGAYRRYPPEPEIASQINEKLLLKSVNIQTPDGGFYGEMRVRVDPETAVELVKSLAQLLDAADAPNFLQMDFDCQRLRDSGEFITVTIQRVHGKTPTTALRELKEEIARLKH